MTSTSTYFLLWTFKFMYDSTRSLPLDEGMAEKTELIFIEGNGVWMYFHNIPAVKVRMDL